MKLVQHSRSWAVNFITWQLSR